MVVVVELSNSIEEIEEMELIDDRRDLPLVFEKYRGFVEQEKILPQ